MAVLRYQGAPEVDPNGIPAYNYPIRGLQLNSLNKAAGAKDSVTVAELKGLDNQQMNILAREPDYKFFVSYDFYGKDNPHFHVPNLYGFEQGKLFTFLLKLR